MSEIMQPKNKEEKYITKRKFLEILTNYQSFRISPQIDVEAELDILYNETIVRIEQLVAAEKLTVDEQLEAVDYQYPASTWQMYKATHRAAWWMRWLVKRRPIKMQTHTKFVTIQIERYAAYPELEIPAQYRGRMMPVDVIKRVYEEE